MESMIQKWVADHFALVQISFLAIVLFVGWNALRSNQKQTSFRKRESERTDLDRLNRIESPIGRKTTPLALPGITLTGKPHEILGVPETANESEIMRAYKERIKLFHPDRIQGDAKKQMRFYQDASAKINEAKEAMIAEIRKK
jgi:DnaJ-class molecular chaperone